MHFLRVKVPQNYDVGTDILPRDDEKLLTRKKITAVGIQRECAERKSS